MKNFKNKKKIHHFIRKNYLDRIEKNSVENLRTFT